MSGGDPAGPVTAGAGVLGVGAAACAACCAGPVLGALSAIGIASAAGYLVAGSAALVVGVAAAAIALRPRRRPRGRRETCGAATSAVAFVSAPAPVAGMGDRPRTGDPRSDGAVALVRSAEPGPTAASSVAPAGETPS